MVKNLYSLILMDDVVKAVDRAAHESGTSRSNYINRILAEHLSVLTPEACIGGIFDGVLRILAGQELLQPSPPSATMLSIRGVLPYRYNPTIHYRVELSEAQQTICNGELRITSRSQNQELLGKLTVFFELWSQVETTCLAEKDASIRLQYGIESGRFRRKISIVADEIENVSLIGEVLGGYLVLLQNAMQIYFEAEYGVDMQVFNQMLEQYRAYLNGVSAIPR